jgi:hypothetical protein
MRARDDQGVPRENRTMIEESDGVGRLADDERRDGARRNLAKKTIWFHAPSTLAHYPTS